MAVSYPLSLPNMTDIKNVRLAQRSIVGMTRSPFTAQQEVQVYAGQWWELDVVLRRMKRVNAAKWQAFLSKLNGKEGTFNMGDPAGASPQGTGGGTPLVNGASQTDQDLVTDGWNTSELVLKAGDYVQLGSGASAHLHMELEDVTSDGAGNATLTLWPDLRESPADGAAIVVTNTVGLFRLPTNETPFDIDEALIYGIAFGAVEAL